jgi:molecular chaperone DnaK (HSP70)
MAYRLGVDIGASYTAAAVNHAGTPTMMRLGGESEKIPSALYLRQDGVTAVGEEAIALGTSRPTLLVRDFRARLGDRTPMLVAGSPYAPQALLARLLAWVVGQAKLQQGVGPDVVTLAYPASWGPFKQELMEQVWRLADLEGPPPVELCPEPVGVATLHAARIGVGEGGVVAVYDLGGTTFDATVLRRTADDFVVVGDPQTLTGSAGVAFDEAVMDHVLTRLEREHQSAPDAAAAPAERFRRSCIAAK